ncbi:hypothetical protein HUJ05_001425 [Dendroctonus ponderosae]|nr:hypothetical protein HUJ05_001425 [Dendroctonus ponderosae]
MDFKAILFGFLNNHVDVFKPFALYPKMKVATERANLKSLLEKVSDVTGGGRSVAFLWFICIFLLRSLCEWDKFFIIQCKFLHPTQDRTHSLFVGYASEINSSGTANKVECIFEPLWRLSI